MSFTLSVTPENLLLIGVFITSALISIAIGTSMCTIAALASLVTELSLQGVFAVEIGAATLVGGAMFGDNMSVISDTTIAAVFSQHANLKEKLKLNIKIALVASFITICVLLFADKSEIDLIERHYSFLLITPYILLVFLAVLGINVFIVMTIALCFSGLVGIIFGSYTILAFAQDIFTGFRDMNEIMLLSILIGGLSGLSNHNPKDTCRKSR